MPHILLLWGHLALEDMTGVVFRDLFPPGLLDVLDAEEPGDLLPSKLHLSQNST